MNKNSIYASLFALGLLLGRELPAGEIEESTLTKVGDPAPTFTCVDLDGKSFSLEQLRGKVVVLDFFATWCGPCVQAMPHLEKEVWQKFKGDQFAMVAVGREHQNQELTAFRQKHQLTFPLAGDPKREVYGKYASQFIPRTYVIDAQGRIVFQSVGYEPEEFAKMIRIIQLELDKQKHK